MTSSRQHDHLEAERLASLQRTQGFCDLDEAEYHHVTRTAQILCAARCAWISILEESGEQLKATQEVPSGPQPILCQRILEGESLFECEGTEDPELKHHDWICGPCNLGPVAGHPFRNAEGHQIGVLCVGLSQGESLSDEQRLGLADLAEYLESRLKLAFFAATHPHALYQSSSDPEDPHQDMLTGLPGPHAILDLLHHSYTRCRLEQIPFSLALVELDPMALESMSVDEAGELLQEAANRLREVLRRHDLVGRWEGGRFLVLLPGLDTAALQAVGNKLVQALDLTVEQEEHPIRLSASVGLVCLTSLTARLDSQTLMAMAEEALQQACDSGRHQARLSPVSQPPVLGGH